MTNYTQRLMAITLSLVLVAGIATPAAFADDGPKVPGPAGSASALPSVVPTHDEVGDAPEYPPGTQSVGGSGSLDTITGTLENDFAVDSYAFCIDDTSEFSADTSDLADWDTQLTLSDASGVIIDHDDDGGEGFRSLIEDFAGSSGVYYIHITSWSNDPEPDEDSGTTITGWENDEGGSSGDYGIAFTGSSGIDACTTVGGESLSIDTTALLLAGAQTNAVWIMSALAVIGSVAFGALYLTSKKN